MSLSLQFAASIAATVAARLGVVVVALIGGGGVLAYYVLDFCHVFSVRFMGFNFVKSEE